MSTTKKTESKALDGAQQKYIDSVDAAISKIINLTKDVAEFKVGDVYIKETWLSDKSRPAAVKKNHLGFPVKFQVVHISPLGVPYLRTLNASGKPYGPLCMPPGLERLEYLARDVSNTQNFWGYGTHEEYRFIPDPEQMDAILLGENYDATSYQRDTSKLYTEVQKYNKSITVSAGGLNTNELEAKKYLLNLPVGDKFWTSMDNFYLIHDKATRKNGEWFLKVVDKNQHVKEVRLDNLLYKRIYKAQPRSFKRESRA